MLLLLPAVFHDPVLRPGAETTDSRRECHIAAQRSFFFPSCHDVSLTNISCRVAQMLNVQLIRPYPYLTLN